jgi:hypothetical protein
LGIREFVAVKTVWLTNRWQDPQVDGSTVLAYSGKAPDGKVLSSLPD